MEERRPDVVFQFSLGAEPLPAETASRLSQRTLAALAGMIARHPKLSFQCFLSSAHANQTLCTLARELPNFSLAGFWWHNFFPAFIERVMRERLDMLAATRQIGFFSDAYTIEWSYAKAVIVRRILSRVLAGKVLLGQYDRQEALAVARKTLFEAPRELLGMEPAVTQVRSTAAKGTARSGRFAANGLPPAARPDGRARRRGNSGASSAD
jgi:glucuronate isomerase